MVPDSRHVMINYEPGNQASVAVACRELASVIGPHAVAELYLYRNVNMPCDGSTIFEAAPALKYAEDVVLSRPQCSTPRGNSDAFMSNFAELKSLRFLLDYDLFRQFNWTFLRHESARELRRIAVYARPSAWPEDDMNRSVEELVRSCATRPLGTEALAIDFSEVSFSRSFALRIIELLKDSGREVTFRLALHEGDELTLDGSDFAVEVDDATIRYASEKSGIFVGVNGRSITIQSTAEALRRSDAAEEVIIPIVD